MMYPKPGGGGMRCSKCGHVVKSMQSHTITTSEVQVKETVVLEGDDIITLPTTGAECEKCGNMTAFWILRQTRKSDEPETRILTCTKCKHRWREY